MKSLERFFGVAGDECTLLLEGGCCCRLYYFVVFSLSHWVGGLDLPARALGREGSQAKLGTGEQRVIMYYVDDDDDGQVRERHHW